MRYGGKHYFWGRLELDDTLPTLAADPDTLRDAIEAVGGDNQVTGKR